MADYYSPTVVDPMIPLAAMLPIERLFLSQVFDEELTSETAYYCSEDGARDLISLAAAEVRAALDAATPETSRLAQRLIEEHPDAILGEDDIDLDMLRAWLLHQPDERAVSVYTARRMLATIDAERGLHERHHSPTARRRGVALDDGRQGDEHARPAAAEHHGDGDADCDC